MNGVVRIAGDGHGLARLGNSESSVICEFIQGHNFVADQIDLDALRTLSIGLVQ